MLVILTFGDFSLLLISLHLKLFKSALKISDDEGNTINVDKRNDKILIEHWGKVEFHHEDLHT
jgi:hypothetical protein